MARFTVLSWNVENFRVADKDVNRIVQHVRGYNPDVFALLEVVGSGVYQHIASRFPGYTFHMTYGRQSQEILVGVRSTLSAFFSRTSVPDSYGDHPGERFPSTIQQFSRVNQRL